jgi:hypothetical protein
MLAIEDVAIEDVESRYAQLSGTFIEKSVLFTAIALTLEIDNDKTIAIVSMGISNNGDIPFTRKL